MTQTLPAGSSERARDRARGAPAGEPSLPPGPALPMPLQTLGWFARPGPLLERCRARYGDMFTLRVAHEGMWVMVSDPEAVKQVFTADPEDVHAGEGNAVLEPIVGT